MYRLCPIIACLAMLLGCQPSEQANADWTTYRTVDQLLSFEHPDSFEVTRRSDSPLGVLFADRWQNVAVSIVVVRGASDMEYASSMLQTVVQGAIETGDRQIIQVGEASGFRQDYRLRLGTQMKRATAIVLVSERGRVLFDVIYPESAKYAEVSQRILDSVKFDCVPVNQIVPQQAGL